MTKKIWFAGGCFWGVEEYFSRVDGVIKTLCGYANGRSTASYETLKDTGHAEAVEVIYDPQTVTLAELTLHFFGIIDPFSVNRQGGDEGAQYRTGIYYADNTQRVVLAAVAAWLQEQAGTPFAVEIMPLENFAAAENFHQEYLKKNPHGYCHVDFGQLSASRERVERYRQLRGKLTDMQYFVTRRSATEPPFENQFNDIYQKGIYVDVTDGTPLFVSCDKFNSGCGWPSFSRPLEAAALSYHEDKSIPHRVRTEVKSSHSGAHLGHVFSDGPAESGGLRYCINSASLRFIPLEDMQLQGYGSLIPLVK